MTTALAGLCACASGHGDARTAQRWDVALVVLIALRIDGVFRLSWALTFLPLWAVFGVLGLVAVGVALPRAAAHTRCHSHTLPLTHAAAHTRCRSSCESVTH